MPRSQWPEDPEEREVILADWDDAYGDRRRQIVVIGRGIDEGALRDALDRCLPTGDEVAEARAGRLRMSYPFPAGDAGSAERRPLAGDPA